MKSFILSLFLMIASINYMIGQGCYFGGNPSATLQKTKYSGNNAFDQINNQEYSFLIRKFGVRPDIYYLIDGNQPNAYATNQISNPNFPDGTVLIGFTMIQNECLQSSSSTCSAVPIIMAHEFAHIVDFKYGTGLSGKRKELFADYLAGAYMFFRSIEFKTTFTNEAAYSFFSKGDYNFNSPLHHGTPDERYNCLVAGYNLAYYHSTNNQYLTMNSLISNAINFVNKY